MCSQDEGSDAIGHFQYEGCATPHAHKDTVIFKQYEGIEPLQLSHHVCDGRDIFMAALKEAGWTSMFDPPRE